MQSLYKCAVRLSFGKRERKNIMMNGPLDQFTATKDLKSWCREATNPEVCKARYRRHVGRTAQHLTARNLAMTAETREVGSDERTSFNTFDKRFSTQTPFCYSMSSVAVSIST